VAARDGGLTTVVGGGRGEDEEGQSRVERSCRQPVHRDDLDAGRRIDAGRLEQSIH
jgi:hypothetical protein